jgi:Domain of unknown function (DUF4347)
MDGGETLTSTKEDEMANVWASHRLIHASWTDSRETGYDYVFLFNSLTDLCNKMASSRLQGKVQILGIVAHGPQFNGGLVKLNRDLTVESISTFTEEFQQLRYYLTRSATVAFYSCTLGYGGSGSALMIEISSRLPGRTIIGFSVWGITSPYFSSNPGLVGYNRYPDSTHSEGFLFPNNDFAKWARDGQIIRLPLAERPSGAS